LEERTARIIFKFLNKGEIPTKIKVNVKIETKFNTLPARFIDFIILAFHMCMLRITRKLP
jgi:hypothetical protein